jgi:hypothetical protein
MQDGKKLPKWNPRSRRAVFLGFSAEHASTVPLVLNLDTFYISPQFHVVFDDWFSTVPAEGKDSLEDTESPPPFWLDLFHGSRYQYNFDDDDFIPELNVDWLDKNERELREHERNVQAVRAAQNQHPSINPPTMKPIPPLPPSTPAVTTPPTPAPPPSMIPSPVKESPARVKETRVKPVIPHTPHVPSPLRRSSRIADLKLKDPSYNVLRTPTPCHTSEGGSYCRELDSYTKLVTDIYGLSATILNGLSNQPTARYSQFADKMAAATDPVTLEFEPASPLDFAPGQYLASKGDPDTLMFHEVMRDEDRNKFVDAMGTEITQLEDRGTWTLVPRSKALETLAAEKDGKQKTIKPGTWTFKRKRYPDGRVKKFKARYCYRGDLDQEGVDFDADETYAPVVQWSTIRLMMTLVLKYDLPTRVVDYTNAFCQAPLLTKEGKPKAVFVEMPKGFEHPDGTDLVLHLKMALYGQSIAPRAWYDKLVASLENQGFKISENDPCLFIHDDMFCFCYVDDTVFLGKDSAKLEAMISRLRTEEELELTDEGELHNYLGIEIDIKGTEPGERTFHLTQKGLIDKVLDATGMTNCKGNALPASLKPLGPDPDGPPFIEDWNYASVIGMLMYLASNSRPDIQFAVHQCARFTHNYRQSHATAIKTILRYLKETRTQGLIMKPTKGLTVDCYVDASFASLWDVEDKQDSTCVKSRTGFVIMIAGCPLLWASKLQTMIALSTTEAEYIALSQSMRELIPMRRLVQEVATSTALNLKDDLSAATHSTVFEDNNGALRLATHPKITPKSKHFAISWHWFKSAVVKGSVEIVRVDTKEQIADIFTKQPDGPTFLHLRMLLCGW